MIVLRIPGILIALALGGALCQNVEQIKSGSGLYFDQLGLAKISDKDWSIITYVNISLIQTELDHIRTNSESIQSDCLRTTRNVINLKCSNIVRALMNNVKVLQEKRENIGQMVTTRVKRGWINIIGKLGKTMFGSLDSDDAKFYDSAISNMSATNKRLEELMMKQIHVTEDSLMEYNATSLKIERNEKLLADRESKIENLLNTTNYEEKLDKLFIEHVELLNEHVVSLLSRLDTITVSLMLAKKNMLHPEIFSAQKLYNIIKDQITSLPSGFELPVNPSIQNCHFLIDIAEVTVYQMNMKLIFVIRIPLVQMMEFDVYKVVPLPVPHPGKSDVFTLIMPGSSHIMVSKDRAFYIPVDNFEKCKRLTDEHYMCRDMQVQTKTEGGVCESQMFSEFLKSVPANCQTRSIKGKVDLWENLSNNRWIFVMSEPMVFTVNCSSKSPEKITLKGTGIISLSQDCTARSKTKHLLPKDVKTFKYENLNFNVDVLKDDCCGLEKYSTMEKIKPIHLENIDLKDLKNNVYKLDSFKEELENFERQPVIVRHASVFQVTIIIMAVVLVMLVCVYIFIKCKKGKIVPVPANFSQYWRQEGN